MALRNQPYFPLYVQDYLTDEKLNLCSWQTQGIYIKLLCLLHKSETYGVLKIKANFIQNESMVDNFSNMIIRQLPCDKKDMVNAITELLQEGVMHIEGNALCQKRMMRDGEISNLRANAGSKGGKIGRNSGTKRYYNEEGYLYLIYDKDDPEAFKIGISKEPDKRLVGIKRKSDRQNLQLRRKWFVSDMGESEQKVLDYFDDIRDGEWIYGSYKIEDIEHNISSILNNKTKAKQKQNTEYEYEYENGDDINRIKDFNIFFEKYGKPTTKHGAMLAWYELDDNEKDQALKVASDWCNIVDKKFRPDPVKFLKEKRMFDLLEKEKVDYDELDRLYLAGKLK